MIFPKKVQMLTNFTKLPILRNLLTCTVILALPLVFNYKVLAENTTTKESDINQPIDTTTDPIDQKLLGLWEIQNPKPSFNVYLLFTPDGKYFQILDGGEIFRFAVPFHYRINTETQPMQLDIISPKDDDVIEQKIFEFTADGLLRLNSNNSVQGKPNIFDGDVFKKVSDITSLPEGIPIYPSENITNEPEKIPEGKDAILKINRYQQAYYLENTVFAETFEKLGIDLKPEDENYRYQLIPQSNIRQSVASTATAKKPGLPSYTGFVYITKDEISDFIFPAIVCETNQPSIKPPAIPSIPKNPSQKAKCPVGSSVLP
jgi:hypothetical protein